MFLHSNHSFDSAQNSDDELWLIYLEGNQKALGRIFLRHYTRLYRYGIKLVGNESAVQDGIQELFLNLWKKRAKINKAHSVEFYLLHSLRRILFRLKKQGDSIHKRNQKYMEGTKLSFHSAEERIVLKELEDERYQLFLKAQESLTKRQKEILYLRLEHGLTNAEISEFLDISMQRVKNCIYESIKLLREKVYQISVEKSA
jgi:RNA polymerase sigma factor (sigma-70 family)